MGWWTSKTEAFPSYEMNFEALKEKLKTTAKEKGLEGTAQLRWTAKKGIYAKSETWNVSGKAPFGSDVFERGNKFLGARDEIARSINLTFGFAQHKGQLIGDYLVDDLLRSKAKQELDVSGMMRSNSKTYLELQDLDVLETLIDSFERNGFGANVGNGNGAFISSVGNLHAHQTEAAIEAGSKKISDCVFEDILAQKREEVSADDFQRNREKYITQAKKRARRTLSRVGMKFRKDDAGNDCYHLNGGLTWPNARNVQKELSRSGVGGFNTAELVRSSILPTKIKSAGAQLLALDETLDNEKSGLLGKLSEEEIDRKLRGSRIQQVISTELGAKAKDIEHIVQENRDITLELKRMSYPDDVTDWNKRQEFYGRLATNLEDMDNAVKELHELLDAHPVLKQTDVFPDLKQVFGIAQELCFETLGLAYEIRPLPKLQNYEARLQESLNLRLPGLTRMRGHRYFEDHVQAGLSYQLEMPEILFRPDSIVKEVREYETRTHNMRTQRLNDPKRRGAYQILTDPDRGRLSKKQERLIDVYQENIRQAIMDNEKLVRSIERRRKMLGQTGDENKLNFSQKYFEAKKQRNALLILLHPNLTRPVVPQAAQNMRANRGREENLDNANAILDRDELDQVGNPHSALHVYVDPWSPDNVHSAITDDYFVPKSGDGLEPLESRLDIIQGELGQLGDSMYTDETETTSSAYSGSDDSLTHVDIHVRSNGQVGVPNDGIQNNEDLGIDCAALKAAQVDAHLWQMQISSTSFKAAENKRGQNRPISEAVHDTLKDNKTLIDKVSDLVDKGQLDDGASRRAISRDLWNNFASLVNVWQRLELFRSEQDTRRNTETQKARRFKQEVDQEKEKENPNSKLIRNRSQDAVMAERHVKSAQMFIKNAKTAMDKLDTFIAKTHCLAHRLSTGDLRDEMNNGMNAFDPVTIERFDRTQLKEHFIDGASHELRDYSENWDKGSSEKKRVDDYLAALSSLHGNLDDLDKVQSEQHREKRDEILNDPVLPEVDRALELNAELAFQLTGRQFDRQYAADSKEAEVVSRLNLDRSNLQKLRLNALMILEGDRQRVQAGVDGVFAS